jgi:hypothetical protein
MHFGLVTYINHINVLAKQELCQGVGIQPQPPHRLAAALRA